MDAFIRRRSIFESLADQMQTQKRIISFCTYRLPVLILYLLFFGVQIFFNLDTDTNRLPFSVTGHQLAASKNHVGAVSVQFSSKKQVSSKLRLNKRFQPSELPAIRVFEVELPTREIAAASTALPKRIVLPSVFLSVHALRGPPVV